MGRLRSGASDAGLAVVLAATVLWLARTTAGSLPLGTLPVAAIYLHVWLTILDGGWTVLRRVTWLLLGLSWFGAVAAGFLAYVLPSGQLGFWLASRVASLPVVGGLLAEWASNPPGGVSLAGVAGLVATVPFAADVAVATVLRLRGGPARRVAAVLAGVAVLVALLWLEAPPRPAPAVSDGPWTPATIVPPWYVLPWFAMLRGPPDKLLGVALLATATLLPLGAPWMRAERFRSGAAGIVWPLLCVALLAGFAGLGWLGAQPPEEDVILASQGLTAGWFAFFLLAPTLLGRSVRRDGGMAQS